MEATEPATLGLVDLHQLEVRDALVLLEHLPVPGRDEDLELVFRPHPREAVEQAEREGVRPAFVRRVDAHAVDADSHDANGTKRLMILLPRRRPDVHLHVIWIGLRSRSGAGA